MSEELKPGTPALAAALAKANAEIHNPTFDKENPHFRSRFASLAAVRNALVPVYAKNGLSIIQDLQTTERGVACFTTLLHSSGEERTYGPLVVPLSKQDAQGIGAAGTYAKRIALQGIACVVGDDDDDGETAVGRDTGSKDLDRPRGVRTVDPRGDLAGKADPQLVAKFVKRFTEAMEADKEEREIAADVYKIHLEVATDAGLYIDIGDALGSKYKNAIRKYVDIYKKAAA